MAVGTAVSFDTGTLYGETNVFTATGSAAAYATASARTGGYVLRCNPASGASGYVTSAAAFSAKVHFGLRIVTQPTVQRVIYGAPGDTNTFNLRLNTDGKLAVYAGSTLIGTSTTALSTNTWYWIGANAESGTSLDRLAINGTVEVTGTMTLSSGVLKFGFSGTESSAGEIWIDDVIVVQTGDAWLQPSKVSLLLPYSDGGYIDWRFGDGSSFGSPMTGVDAIPLSGVASASETSATNIESVATSGTAEVSIYCESYSSRGITSADTIVQVYGIARHGEDISTGTKGGSVYLTSNPSTSGTTFNFGDDAGAHAAEAGGLWKTAKTPVANSPSVDLSTTPGIGVVKTSTSSRAVCLDFVGVVAVWTPSSGTPKSGTDSGAGTDTKASLDSTNTRTDSSTGTDAATLAAASATQTESATATDTATVSEGAVEKTGTDSGAGTDTSAGIALGARTESGAGTDTASLAAATDTRTDSGAGTDSGAAISLGARTESSSATDTAAVSVPITGTDAGTGTDASTGIALGTRTESGAGTDAATLAAVTDTRTDSGAGTDASASVALGARTESGTATDAAALAAATDVRTDSGAGTDTSTAPVVAHLATDAGTATDGPATVDAGTIGKTGSDSAAATDTAALAAASDTRAESASATDTATVTITVADSASGTDSGATIWLGTRTESASATDTATLASSSATRSETGTGTDTAALATQYLVTDSASATDTGTTASPVSASDSASATDTALLAAALGVGTETGSATDAATLSVVLEVRTDSASATDTGTKTEETFAVTASDTASATDAAGIGIATSDGSTGGSGTAYFHLYDLGFALDIVDSRVIAASEQAWASERAIRTYPSLAQADIYKRTEQQKKRQEIAALSLYNDLTARYGLIHGRQVYDAMRREQKGPFAPGRKYDAEAEPHPTVRGGVRPARRS